MTTRVTLIRHGQTEWNIQRRYLGLTDIGLNDEGRRQAEKVRKRLAAEHFDKVYSSDRRRARESAELIFTDMHIEPVPELREMDFGVFEGLTYDEIDRLHPDVYKAWINDPLNIRIPDGESFNLVKERVMGAMNRILTDNPGLSIAVISHAGPISVMMQEYKSSKGFWEGWPEPGCISVLEFDHGKANVLVCNDISHMEG